MYSPGIPYEEVFERLYADPKDRERFEKYTEKHFAKDLAKIDAQNAKREAREARKAMKLAKISRIGNSKNKPNTQLRAEYTAVCSAQERASYEKYI